MESKLKIGFVGLGIMGAPMAGHLLAGGHELFVYARRSVPPELASATADLLASPTERRELGGRARAFVASHHSWSAYEERLNAMYSGLMNDELGLPKQHSSSA